MTVYCYDNIIVGLRCNKTLSIGESFVLYLCQRYVYTCGCFLSLVIKTGGHAKCRHQARQKDATGSENYLSLPKLFNTLTPFPTGGVAFLLVSC